MGVTSQILEVIITALVSLIASSGFWLYIGNKREVKSLQTELLIGLAHDRITYLGMRHISRGYICQEEYENLRDYLFAPYEKLGGNGSAKRIMAEVDKLPIRNGINCRKEEKGELTNEIFE